MTGSRGCRERKGKSQATEPSSKPPPERLTYQHPGFELHSFVKINFCYFKPPSLLPCALVSPERSPNVVNSIKVREVEI